MQHASAVESPRILLLSKPRGGAEPRIVVDDKFLVTSLPESSSWLHGVGSSCHGLLCFHDFYDRASYVLNPLTREVVLLPGVDPLRERWRPFSVGVGASRLTGRYKIVRLSYLRDGAVLAFRAEVLDQGSWSWRKVASAPPNLLLEEPVFAAGSIHWTDLGAGLAVGISSFDLAKEEFAPTPCPEGFRDPYLVELQGVLGLVDCLGEESVDVWVREEESGRWTKEYSVRLVPPLPMSSRYSLNVRRCGGGRKIALNYEDSFWFYDPATDELRHEQRDGASRATVACSITVSLLSPAQLWNDGG
ncbi:F-box/kelch-repeat protein At3g23880-like [Eucalyptus grandis]|uniref:F-box/kelch-repeat protein At3g23880-like n=1 Tax=Eucalyptus grandis TaxID=71139 RepID=UPI00192E8124|nr:F-box/kelch-repeat protein At3g23880-like [Eucalyptus grandis]